jgi:DNA-binding response OmpR family regulator
MHRIHIVDDEPYILHVLAIKLTNAGFEVLTSPDGQEALRVVRAESPEMLITDFQMPHMDGLALAETCRQDGMTAMPILLITAREFDLPPQRVKACGIARVLAKPFSPRQVVRVVRELLDLSPASTAPRESA